MTWYQSPFVVLSSINPDAVLLSPVTVFPTGNPTLRFEDWNLSSAVALTVLDVTEPDALLVLPKKIFLTNEKEPVGTTDTEFAVSNSTVSSVASVTINVSLNYHQNHT